MGVRKQVLRKIFLSVEEEVAGTLEKVELLKSRNLYFSPNFRAV